MRGRRDDMAGAGLCLPPPPLQPLHRRNAEFADEAGVLAERLLDAAPARVARDVDDGRESEVHAACAHLARDQRVDVADEIGIPGRGEPDGLREGGRVLRRETVERFLVKEDGDAEAGVLARPFLRSDEHTSELQSLMRTSYAVFCLK